MIGIPKYDYKDCTAYVIEKLRDNGFIVRYTHPNLLFISWKHWIPTYVRNEIKKKTGKNIDEYGNIIDNNSNNSNNSNNFNNINNSIQSQSNNTNSYDNIIINKSENSSNSKNKDYKDIKTYKPSGSLIYNNNLLKKLDINDL